MKVFWRPAAADDFERLIAEAGQRSMAEVARQKAAVESRILLLERFRDLGRKTRRVGVRELAVDGTPYVVVNRRVNDEVLVLRVFDASKPG